MRECLDEGILQSFCDGELSGSQVERVTAHLTHCSSCSAAMQELLSYTELVSAALEPEFQAAVPSEQLRARINAAVDGLNGSSVRQIQGTGSWFGSLAGLFSLRPQQALAYASLAAVLAFAAIFGVAYFKQTPVVTNEQVAQTPRDTTAPSKTVPPQPTASQEKTAAPAPEEKQKTNTQTPQETAPPPVRPSRRPYAPREAVAKVKLLPGEKSYLKTIAALDSTIKNEKPMQPALRAEFERNLALVDRALAAARNAAKKNPNDPDAAEFVFSAYQSKVDLLNTVADARVYNRQP
jgi:anti-sigma factor RsiW